VIRLTGTPFPHRLIFEWLQHHLAIEAPIAGSPFNFATNLLLCLRRLLIDGDHFINNGNWMWLSCSAFFNQYYRSTSAARTCCAGVAHACSPHHCPNAYGSCLGTCSV
jgi:FAD binding domain of DNA photolyase